MSVSRDDLDRMAELARLDLADEEAESLMRDLNGILDHVETLGEVDSTEVEEDRVSYREGSAPLREDDESSPDPLLRTPADLAPAWEEGFFAVPRLPGLEGAEG